MKLIAISGGIGSGKSIVSRALAVMGYDVYDCDSHAREIMDCDRALQLRIATDICAGAVVNGHIDRRRLAEKVFNDEDALNRLNSMVHQAVKDDIAAWVSMRDGSRSFIETAILYQSGIDLMADEVWEVSAPTQLRLQRAVDRGMNEDDARSRMAVQDEYQSARQHQNVKTIVNDGVTAVIPQLLALLDGE